MNFKLKTVPFLSLLLFLIFTSFISYSQDKFLYENKIYNNDIKTVLFYRVGWEFSYPVLELNSDKKLVLEFDVLGNDNSDYSYTIIHCDSEWNPSDLNPLEYISGFEENQLQNYQSSFNTLVEYTHYTLNIPNENVQPLISGNYLLLIYEGYDREIPILSRRFYVFDEKVKTDALVKRSTIVNSIDDSQELEIVLIDKSNFIFNPIDDLTIKVIQNNISQRSFLRKSPDFIKGNKYEYINARKNRIQACNEFRYFNVKNTKYVTDRVNSIYYNKPFYIFELVKEKPEAFLPYTYAQDINGDLLIVADNIDDPQLEADYVYVDFTFYYEHNLSTGNFYVFGALSGWECNDNNKMEYDFGEKAYKLRMLLKQGFYNYEYVFMENGTNILNLNLTEGNHYETENNYLIFVYYTPQGSNFEQLIGFRLINSLNRL